jgi:Predicted RNA polymerase sigma factor containing a TPR repeat domain
VADGDREEPALDRLRQEALHARKREELGHDLDALEAHLVPDFVDSLDAARADDIGDDLLRLVFTACHPVLSTDARVALTLRLLGGLTTDEIARAFLVPEPTIAQRIVRAKRTLSRPRCRSKCRKRMPVRHGLPRCCR